MRYRLDVWLESPDGEEKLFFSKSGYELDMLQAVIGQFAIANLTLGNSMGDPFCVPSETAHKISRIELRPERRLVERVAETIEERPR